MPGSPPKPLSNDSVAFAVERPLRDWCSSCWTAPAAVADLGPVSKPGQPVVYRGYVDDGLVADGEFVISGRDGAVAFESVDVTFHSMTGAVVVGVELVRATAAAAAPQPCGGASDFDRSSRSR